MTSGARLLHAAHRRVGRDDSVDGRPAAAGARRAPATRSARRSASSPSPDRSGCCSFPVSRYSSTRSTPTCRSSACSSAGSLPGIAARARSSPDGRPLQGWLHGAMRTPFEGRRGGSQRSGRPSGNCCCRSSCSAASSPGVTTLVEAAALRRASTPWSSSASSIASSAVSRDVPRVDRRMRHARRRLPDHPQRGARPHELSRHRRRADAHPRAGARGHDRVSPIVFLLALNVLPHRRRRADGHLLGDRGRRAADAARSPPPTASTRSTWP